jgi:hypothetical protein
MTDSIRRVSNPTTQETTQPRETSKSAGPGGISDLRDGIEPGRTDSIFASQNPDVLSHVKDELEQLKHLPSLLNREIDKWRQQLDSYGDDAQLANVDLQNILQKQQQTLQMMSNISKMLSDTANAVIRKLGG